MRLFIARQCATFAAVSFVVSPVAAQVRYQFTATQLDASVRASNGPQAIALTDIDKVNGLDIVGVDYENASVNVYLNDGTGGFAIEPDDSFDTDDGPVAVASGDFDRNGTIDLVTVNDVAHTASILLGTGDCSGAGCFDDTIVDPISVASVPVGVVVADLDRDGKPDLAVLNDSSVYLLRGNGDGTFVPFPTSVVVTLGGGGKAIVAGDFDQNGTIDLAVSNGQTGQVSILLGNGDGTFKRAVLYNVGSDPLGMTVGDFDGDGKLDIAVADSDPALFDENVAILVGQGDGSFVAASPPAEGSGEQVTSVAPADLDGDGRPELAVASLSSHAVDVLQNCTSDQAVKCPPPQPIVGEFFQLRPTIAGLNLGDGMVAIEAGDLNRDGKIDLVALGESGDDIGVFLNVTSATSPTPTPTPTATLTRIPTFTATPTPTETPSFRLTSDGCSIAANSSGTSMLWFVILPSIVLSRFARSFQSGRRDIRG